MSRHIDTLFLSHGGGPLPLLGDPAHRDMVKQLTELSKTLAKPSAILVISAHWEAPVPTITSSEFPPLIHDYYGFPPESYDISYPCPGDPELARQIFEVLGKLGMEPELDATRGLDHGVFVPLKIMYPEADIPCVQLSLISSLNAGEHIALGKALQELDDDNLLVIGSGFSFHNMKAFFRPESPDLDDRNRAFESWLEETFGSKALNEAERATRIREWETAPHARFCHPREEHLLPLFVCYGLNERASDQYLSAKILGKKSGTFLWDGKVKVTR